MRVSPLQSYCVCERAKRHVRLVSLYIGLQAVFIIFHYSCFMHDCARRAVIGSVGVEANQGRLNSGAQHSDSPEEEKKTPLKCGDLYIRQNISQEESKLKISCASATKNVIRNLQRVFIFGFAETCSASRD